jgi:hypothetical protein
MSRLPKGTHEFTDRFGVPHYVENIHRMWDLAIMLNRDDVEVCNNLSKSDYDRLVQACHNVGMTYWNSNNIVRYYGALIGKAFERLSNEKSLQQHVNNHRSLCGLTEVQF